MLGGAGAVKVGDSGCWRGTNTANGAKGARPSSSRAVGRSCECCSVRIHRSISCCTRPLLPHPRPHAAPQVIPKELADGSHRVLKMGAFLLGYGLMSLLAVWA